MLIIFFNVVIIVILLCAMIYLYFILDLSWDVLYLSMYPYAYVA